jgi:hypothetical protein
LGGAWGNIKDRQDLNFLGISVRGGDYRYYAGLNMEQCGIFNNEDCRQKGYDYLATKYSWLFDKDENQKGAWGGYDGDDGMYLYKKVDILGETTEETTQKILCDLNNIYEKIIDRC